MNALDIFNAEMDFNVSSAEFTELFNIKTGETVYSVYGYISRAWKRKETDGRLEPGSPMEIPSVVVPSSTLSVLGIESKDYRSLVVEIDGEEMGVISYEAGNPVRLFLKSDMAYDIDEDEEPSPEEPSPDEPDPDPPLVEEPEPEE